MSHQMTQGTATVADLVVHAAWMRGLALRLLGDRDEADDVVQETWLSALRVPPERGRTLRPWIATVMRNLIRSRVRRSVRVREREAVFAAADPAPGAEELLAQRRTERVLAQLVLGLAEPYRRTILMRFHEGRTSAEIARSEGIPEGTVRWRLKCALDELRRRFGDGDNAGKNALFALMPIAGLATATMVSPAAAAITGVAAVPGVAAPSVAAHWVAHAALLKGCALLTVAGAATALVVVTTEVRRPALSARSTTVAAATSPPGEPPSPVPAPAPPIPDDEAGRPGNGLLSPPTGAAPAGAEAAGPLEKTVMASRTRQPTALTPITGIVRDSRGEAAARVPVTVRTLSGSGAAERITITDDVGRFRYQLRPRSRFVLTAELRDEPAARVEIEVHGKSSISLDAGALFTSTAANFATIEVALDDRPPRTKVVAAKNPRDARAQLSRWCCHRAYAVDGASRARLPEVRRRHWQRAKWL